MYCLADVAVSIPDVFSVDESRGSFPVCATLSTAVDIKKDVEIMLVTKNGTGKWQIIIMCLLAT